MADTKSSKSWEQTEWQGGEGFRGRSRNISRSKTEREEVIATDVPNTKRMGWTERAEIREASQRKGWADKSSNSSSTVTETEDATNSNDKRLQGFRQHKQLEREQREDEFAKSSTPTTEHRATQCRMGYMVNGISEALFGHFSEEPKDIPRVAQNQKDRTKKLKALGNSIVPQVVAELFYAIRIAEYGE
jgi:DNA (cytosine-5)-methyltransferase 1